MADDENSGAANGSVTLFFNRLRIGDDAAAMELWTRYLPRLAALARKYLSGRPQRAADADDAVQSAFASFCRQVKRGEFEIDDRSDLWNLLGLITTRKARAQVRRELSEKRGGGRTLDEGAMEKVIGTPLPLDQAAETRATADFDLHVSELLAQLDPELREIAVLRMMRFQNSEIAQRLDCTERKVERKLRLIRLAWESEWPESCRMASSKPPNNYFFSRRYHCGSSGHK